MATYNYQTKSNSTFVFRSLDSAAQWSDAEVSWSDAGEFWGEGNTPVYTYQSKSASGGATTATPGLYYGFGAFTYSGGEVVGSGDSFTYQTKN